MAGADELSERARETIEDADTIPLVSAASIWEMAIKESLGKLEVPDDFLAVARGQGFQMLEITPAHAWEVRRLPLNDHKDPFDRLLVVQALYEELPVISNDGKLDQYSIQRRW